jgi:hypothetical protein
MHYCQFENLLPDLKAVVERLRENDLPTSTDEQTALREIMALATELIHLTTNV